MFFTVRKKHTLMKFILCASATFRQKMGWMPYFSDKNK